LKLPKKDKSVFQTITEVQSYIVTVTLISRMCSLNQFKILQIIPRPIHLKAITFQ